MRAYKIWAHFVLAVLAAVFSVSGMVPLGYWAVQVYDGNPDWLGENGGRFLLASAAFCLVQVVLYALALLVALSIPRVHKVARLLFRIWIGATVLVLLAMMALFRQNGLWDVLAVSYPFLSFVTGICAVVSLHKSAKRLGKRPSGRYLSGTGK